MGRRARDRRQKDDARGPMGPPDCPALAGHHATPDCSTAALACQNSEAVMGGDTMTDESKLEEDLWAAVTWIGLLDKIVDDMESLPGMSKREIDISYGQLYCVTEALKKAIYRADANYHDETKEEAVAAA